MSVETEHRTKNYVIALDDAKICVKITKCQEEGFVKDTSNFKELLEHCSSALSKKRWMHRGEAAGSKILFRGGIGVGKSFLVKKVAQTWGRGTFASYVALFVVDATQFGSHDGFGNMLIEQTGLTQIQIKLIFERLGHKCLIILDGVDVMRQNKSLSDIIRQPGVNVLVTTSGADTAKTNIFENHFKTVFCVEGFSEDEVDRFWAALKASYSSDAMLNVDNTIPLSLHLKPKLNPMLVIFTHFLLSNNIKLRILLCVRVTSE